MFSPSSLRKERVSRMHYFPWIWSDPWKVWMLLQNGCTSFDRSSTVSPHMHCFRIASEVALVIALRRYGTKSWNPWLLSLALEVTSLGIHAHSPRKHKSLERDEMQRRAWLLTYYILRDPVYSLFVKERLNKFCDGMAKRPIISLASNLLADYIPLWENYYFLVNP
ncbi:peroxisomal membrane protein-domain-containing protein [Chytriomyces sp. MP71]|nr:peroxisomal membrane protein-domain-containing protein [Chytriomyces sp. MP71]